MATLTKINAAPCPSATKRAQVSLFEMLQIAHQRRKLAQLDAATLRDIGLTRTQALTEAKRPFWDI